jgi:hypothetical protein
VVCGGGELRSASASVGFQKGVLPGHRRRSFIRVKDTVTCKTLAHRAVEASRGRLFPKQPARERASVGYLIQSHRFAVCGDATAGGELRLSVLLLAGASFVFRCRAAFIHLASIARLHLRASMPGQRMAVSLSAPEAFR